MPAPITRIERYNGLPTDAHLRQIDADLDLLDAGIAEIKKSIDSIKNRANGILASLVVAALMLAANLVLK